MKRIQLSADLSLSQIALGLWRLTDYGDSSPRGLQERLEVALEHGISTIDQADIYGGYESEAVLGNCLRSAPGLRSKLEIVTKCDIIAPVGRHSAARVKHYDTGREHIEASVNSSLALMSIEQIDLLLLHRPDPLMDHRETGGTLDRLVQSGKVGSIGVSNFKPWDWELLQSAMHTPLATNQIEFSLLQPAPLTNGDIAFHQKLETPLMAWSPLGGGSLIKDESNSELSRMLDRVAEEQNVDRAAIAIAWLLAHPARIIPVVGSTNIERIAQITKSLDLVMDRQTWFELYTAALGHEVP